MSDSSQHYTHFLDRVVANALKGGLPIVVFFLSITLGTIALLFTPREEEPQIVVPMANVLVTAPGLSALQIENQVTKPLEKLLSQITGLEHLYSRSDTGKAIITLRFFVGQNREDSILNVYTKLFSNQEHIPGMVTNWVIKPVEVDDVPIVLLGLWSSAPELYDDYDLRRFADEITVKLQQVNDTNQIHVAGGRRRVVSVEINSTRMASRQVTALDIVNAIKASNQLHQAGIIAVNNETIQLESGDYLRTLSELKNLSIRVIGNAPIYLKDVADISDGPEDSTHYSWLNFSPNHLKGQTHQQDYPLVTISVAKKRGANAVAVAQAIHAEMDKLKQDLLPPEVHVEVLRDYGQTANDKVNNLTSSLAFAIVTVIVFIAIFLGWRPALVVGLAIPICYGATLALDMAFGYTINRVTLFALILALGLLVDDPITGIDNIERYMRMGTGNLSQRIILAMAEIRPALLMSTLTIILAFIPLAFITGMMGPYMAPMAFNVPIAVSFSTLVAFIVTPWLASKALKPSASNPIKSETTPANLYQRLLAPCIASRQSAWRLVLLMLVLFLLTAAMPVFRLVPLKLLPYDNKDEMQIIIDMPESSTLEQTAAVTREAIAIATRLPEIQAAAAYVGIPSPIDFNGLVRQYDYRLAVNMADIRLTLAEKTIRQHQSHAVLLRMRKALSTLNTNGISIKIVEVPPGPPVISTLVAEIYGDTLTAYDLQRSAAKTVMQRLAKEPLIVDIDSSVEEKQKRWRFIVDKEKTALAGINTDLISQTIRLANQGQVAGYYNLAQEIIPIPIIVRLPETHRSNQNDLLELPVKFFPSEHDHVPALNLSELGQFSELDSDQAIYHKDLKPVVYVMAELEGRTPAEVIADVDSDLNSNYSQALAWNQRNFLSSGGGIPWNLPEDIYISWSGEGEWNITVRVFRDMGLAFAFALIGIFFVLRIQTSSVTLSLLIMSSIPLTIIGIMPGFWLLNQFGERLIEGSPDPVLFTATAMIGMIALAGIVVRNALILVEFITQARMNGLSLNNALLQAGSIRMRPVLLTAGTTLLGNIVIVLDPVFSGLAIAIIFGIIASTLFTLFVIPSVYFLLYADKETQ